MMRGTPLLSCLLLALLAGAAAAAADKPAAHDDDEPHPNSTAAAPRDDDDADRGAQKSEPLALTAAQQDAVGIRIDHPLPLRGAPPIAAYGTVLDPGLLVADAGRVASTQAAAQAAGADAARVERLYHDDAQASLKTLQAAQAQSVEAEAQARAAAMSFRLQWGPLADLAPAQRRALLESLSHGQQVLLRADVPGYSIGGALEPRALVTVDGMNVAARVLGPMPRSQAQSAGWLLTVEHGPPGLGPGTRAAVELRGAAAVAGLLVPAAALLYAEQGAYVYRQERAAADTFHYQPVPVKPLARVGTAWLVTGLSRADPIVVQGAGVLWSLQGISSFSAAEEEHD